MDTSQHDVYEHQTQQHPCSPPAVHLNRQYHPGFHSSQSAQTPSLQPDPCLRSSLISNAEIIDCFSVFTVSVNPSIIQHQIFSITFIKVLIIQHLLYVRYKSRELASLILPGSLQYLYLEFEAQIPLMRGAGNSLHARNIPPLAWHSSIPMETQGSVLGHNHCAGARKRVSQPLLLLL